MVKIKWIGLLVLLTISLAAQEVIVTTDIDQKGKVGMPLKGTITITHDRSLAIDANSFMLGEEPLEAEHLKEVQVGPNSPLTISIYTFTLIPNEPGLKELPEVKVDVGGQEYRSFASTYKVEEIKAAPTSPGGKTSVVLRIEPLIIGKTPLYPGQRIQVGYRYIFNYSQDLKKEVVPLLEAKGFRKIGGKSSETKMSGKLVHLDVLQQIEAVEPGEYFFEPAKIEGRAWRKGRFGQKDFAVRDSFAESAPSTITVLPFPKKGQPPSFNGAIGEKLSFQAALLTSDEAAVGDKMRLKLTFKGKGELATLPLPEVCCQPGMSGFFRLSDLPPQESIQGDVKAFTVEMRPLNAKVKQIPTLEFSYFNPVDKTYHTEKSQPIPIAISPLQKEDQQILREAKGEERPSVPAGVEKKPSLGAIEIEGNFPLEGKDLENRPFGAPWVIFLLPFWIGGIFLQSRLRAFMRAKGEEVQEKTSRSLFQDALEAGVSHPQFYQMLHDALVFRLYERGEVQVKTLSAERLPDTGMAAEVKAFLKEIEEKRFSQSGGELGSDIIERAEQLFKKLWGEG